MGNALARAALRAGHKVTLITAPANLRPPRQAEVVNVESAAEMFMQVKRQLGCCDCLIMAAAVSDYTPSKPSKHKIRRTNKNLTLKLKPTADILKWAGKHKRRGQIIVGFALEDRDIEANAERKLREKKLDMIVANTPQVIGRKSSEVLLKVAGGDWYSTGRIPKESVASQLIRRICKLIRI